MPRSPLRLLLALSLGFAAACLVACGSSKGLLASTSADGLQGQLDAISADVKAGDCSGATSAAHDLGARVNALPASVDRKLRSALSDGARLLLERAASECQAPKTTVSTDTTTTDTTPSTETTTTTTPSTASTETKTTTTPTTPTTKTNTTPTTPTAPGNGGAGQGAGNGGAGTGRGK
jgi:hypothetical protein